ncbi:MAG: hypothetical protein UR28_C0007G0010 [Candidatus Peregrinibacteria bacterium GW2011_GWF2_33_10]|nr:MAG: hypothetical protein UR28_C0007G0010 [Candidatus Peregrinibacteria bacterium GW2011_GWF2_33_10]OGJ44242.1 MAG: hypothetical protein A2272_04095 [Candidatus Peregrinibacteria bacterium RIFOXYA12_FULL_33_12]OGJ44900.1 MAG: hypothetical protein A2263_03160 [Candidatus Peregrinibacteria bacterium RIFOXYA2_FULL_33_21]OGJ50659.1 MAG: hypothetical protein A2307_03450 [Candidatus Peregrinibacteria bacterium RIFOXYB2_FULL_33_20]
MDSKLVSVVEYLPFPITENDRKALNRLTPSESYLLKVVINFAHDKLTQLEVLTADNTQLDIIGGGRLIDLEKEAIRQVLGELLLQDDNALRAYSFDHNSILTQDVMMAEPLKLKDATIDPMRIGQIQVSNFALIQNGLLKSKEGEINPGIYEVFLDTREKGDLCTAVNLCKQQDHQATLFFFRDKKLRLVCNNFHTQRKTVTFEFSVYNTDKGPYLGYVSDRIPLPAWAIKLIFVSFDPKNRSFQNGLTII